MRARLAEKTREKLRSISTASVTTALFKRGLRNQCIQGVRPLSDAQPTMVGEAYTLRYIPAREDLNPITVFRCVSAWNRDPVGGVIGVQTGPL